MSPAQASSSDASTMAAPDLRRCVDLNALILHRVRIALVLIAALILLTTPVSLPIGEIPAGLLLELKAAALGLVAFGYALSRWPRAKPYAAAVAWALGATCCAAVSLTGIVTGDSYGVLILCVGVTLMTATFFHWGVPAQLATTLWATGAIAANLHWSSNAISPPVSSHAAAAAALTLTMSLVIAFERQATWQRMRRENLVRAKAEARTARLHRHLEQIVAERTSLVEATRRDLERQIASHATTLRQLRENEQELRDIVDNSSAFIYVKDLGGRYRFMGIQCERRFGIPRDRIIGKTVADFFPPEVAAASTANDRVVLATGQAVESEDIVPTREGPATFLTWKFPLRDAIGATCGLCGISTDITARKQTEVELRRAEALFSSVIESSNEAIWSVDRDYRFTAWNSVLKHRFREFFGSEPQIGVALEECLPRDTWRYWRGLLAQALLGRQLVVECPVIVKGTPRQVLVSLNPVNEDGTITGIVVFTKEITGVRKAEEQLRQRQADLAHALRLSTIGEMASGLARELRRPLATIAGIAHECRQEIQSGRLDPAAFAERIRSITTAALGTADSLRHLRRLLRRDDSTRDPVDMNEVTRNAARIAELQHPEFGLQLDLAPGLPCVPGDRIQLEQVVLNLLLNAIDATPAVASAPRTVAVHTALAGGDVEVAVHDTGSGVDPAIRHRLFASSVTTKPNGLGLGLAISRSIVEAHGGQLWEAPNPAGGSIFRFTVPVP
jgi:PAS domain S-box-containing protein